MNDPESVTHAHHATVDAAQVQTAQSRASNMTASDYESYTRQMHESMQKMMADMHRDPPSGDPDVDFLVMMIPHHQGAIDMARLVLASGSDPLVRALAEDIMAAQAAEIAGMQGRLKALRRGGSPDDAFPALRGTSGSN